MAIAFLQRLAPREKTLLGTCFIIILIAIGNRVVVKPIRDKFGELGREIKTADFRLNGNYETIAQQDVIYAEFDGIKDHVAHAEPGQDQGPIMLTEIERLATSCQVNLLERKVQEVLKPDEFFEQYSAKVDVQGTIEQIIQLLYKFDTSAQLLRVQKIELSPDADRQNVLKVSLLITKIISV